MREPSWQQQRMRWASSACGVIASFTSSLMDATTTRRT